jgi:hypothetical protein
MAPGLKLEGLHVGSSPSSWLPAGPRKEPSAVMVRLTCCTPSANEHTPKADTRTTKHGYQCSVYDPNTFSLRPQSVHASDLTGPHQISGNCVAQSRHTSSLGSHPAERPPRATLTSAPCTLPRVAPAANLCIEGSLSPMRMRSSPARETQPACTFRGVTAVNVGITKS